MASVKRTADKPEDLDLAGAVEEVAGKNHQGAGRPNDNVIGKYKVPNSTFASRSKGAKRVASASNKAVTADETEAK